MKYTLSMYKRSDNMHRFNIRFERRFPVRKGIILPSASLQRLRIDSADLGSADLVLMSGGISLC